MNTHLHYICIVMILQNFAEHQVRPKGVFVEWLILADAAQVVSNKLYLLGGGWDVLTINRPLPLTHPVAIALSIRVPWNETNQKHDVEVEIGTEDGKTLATIGAQLEVGRPPGIHPGQDQRAQLAVNVGLQIERPGIYVIIGRIAKQELARTYFNVVLGPGAIAK